MSTATAEPPATSETQQTQESVVSKPANNAEQLGNMADFAAKFGQPTLTRTKGHPRVGVINPAEASQEEGKAEVAEVAEGKQQAEGEPKKIEHAGKKLNYVEQQKQLAAEAQKKAEEYEAKIKKYESEDIPGLNNRIQELEKLINDTDSKKKTEELQKELDGVKGILESKDTENRQLKERLSLLDLPNDPDFKQRYEAPMNAAYGRTAAVLGNDNAKLIELQKAFNCVTASLKSTDQNEVARQYNLAMEIVNGVHEQLTPIQQAQFQGGFWELVAKAREYVDAINGWQTTSKQITEERQKREQEQAFQSKQRWSAAYKGEKDKLSATIKHPEEIARAIATHQIQEDTSLDEALANAIIEDGATKYSPEQVSRIIAQGAAYGTLKARIQAQEKMISELNETIAKLRGTQTGGAESAQPGATKAEPPTEKTPASLAAWAHQQFAGKA